MNIVLIGYRGTGKSTVARLVAERLGWDWIDADACVEARAGMSIREIFECEGELGFRDRESAVLRELARRDRVVIATGGGAVVRVENRDLIRGAGFTVWLVASPAVIVQRVESDPTNASRRPALSAHDGREEVRRLLAERESLYRGCSDAAVETDSRSPEQLADEIVQSFQASRPIATE